MKLLEGTIYTRDIEKLAKVLEADGLTVIKIVYDGRKLANAKMCAGFACLYDLINRVKIRTLINDELVGTMMDTLGSFGTCKLSIFSGEPICPA